MSVTMGINKLVIVLCVVCVVRANCDDDDLKEIDSIQNERPCLEQGGICTMAADCPDGLLATERGLCPAQQRRGVECCHGISVKETRCAERGGVCTTEYCTTNLIFDGATDCIKGTICCTAV